MPFHNTRPTSFDLTNIIHPMVEHHDLLGRGFGRTFQKVLNPIQNVKRWRPPVKKKLRKRSQQDEMSIGLEGSGLRDQQNSPEHAKKRKERRSQFGSEYEWNDEDTSMDGDVFSLPPGAEENLMPELTSRLAAVEHIAGLEDQLEAGSVVYVFRRMLKLPTGYENLITRGNRTFRLDAAKNLGFKFEDTKVRAIRKYGQAERIGIRVNDSIVRVQGKDVFSDLNIRKAIDDAKSTKETNFSFVVSVDQPKDQEPRGPWLRWPRTEHVFTQSAQNVRRKELRMVLHLRRRLFEMVHQLTGEEAYHMYKCLDQVNKIFPCADCELRAEAEKSIGIKSSSQSTWQRAKKMVGVGMCSSCVGLRRLLKQGARKHVEDQKRRKHKRVRGAEHYDTSEDDHIDQTMISNDNNNKINDWDSSQSSVALPGKDSRIASTTGRSYDNVEQDGMLITM